jgi:hypothetical protein
MCEYCKKTEVTIETLDTDDQYPCEWITEEAGPGACAELRFTLFPSGTSRITCAMLTSSQRKKRWKKVCAIF